MQQDQTRTNATLQTLEELLNKLLAVSSSLEEASASGAEGPKFNKPYPALININMSSECEESVQGDFINVGFSHTTIDYIDEVSVCLNALCLRRIP